MTAVAPHLMEEKRQTILEEAVAVARKIEDEWGRAYHLVTIAIHLSEETRTSVLEEALEVTRKLNEEAEEDYVFMLQELAPYLPEAVLGQHRIYSLMSRDEWK